ncbi:glycosyltransferase family 2 protein [Alphaproteobacteria bacterium]|nr:glycosyltransferase family 2 protein [Alphaproteobacteria bacterium]
MKNISIIIPSHSSDKYITELLLAIKKQTLQPLEIIIIDSYASDEFTQKIKKIGLEGKVKIINYNKVSYPSNKRNFGASIARGEFLAFLDVKTIPEKNWLENYYNYCKKNNYFAVFGCTKYNYNNFFQKLLLFASYGFINHETTPGTLISKENFKKIGKFFENVRAGEDEEWRSRIKKNNYKTFYPTAYSLQYSHLPENLIETTKKYFQYSLHTSLVQVQQKIKNLYLSILLLFSALIIPKWNHMLSGWNQNPLYIPHITKIYIISFLIILLILLFFYFFTNFKIFILRSIFFKFFCYLAFIIVSISIYYWNERVANWVESAVWYIPHITKIYTLIVVSLSIFIRGIYMPLKKEVPLKSLFIFNWLYVGLLGVILDLIKAPGYILGALIYPFISLKNLVFKK